MPNKLKTQNKTKQSKTWNLVESLWNRDAFYFRTVFSFVYHRFVRMEKKLHFARKYALDVSMILFVLTIGTYVLFPTIVNADNEVSTTPNDKTVALMVSAMQNQTKDFGHLPVAEDATAKRTFHIPITAYTSDVAQTDDTPCITASGLNLCERNQEDIVAANFLPLGTRVRIPELYGDRVFYVQDRMNARYDKHMDIWMRNYSDAKHFGLQYVEIEVF